MVPFLASLVLATLSLEVFAQQSTAPQAPVQRALIIVPIQPEASWQDHAFLAAIPAACSLGTGEPMVLAVEADAPWSPEVLDFLQRYQPQEIYWLGELKPKEPLPTLPSLKILSAYSAVQACTKLAQHFWQQSDGAVLFEQEQLAHALSATALAARLGQPLFPCVDGKIDPSIVDALQTLGVTTVLYVGTAQAPKLKGQQVVRLKDALEVTQWMTGNGLGVNYIAAVNPLLKAAKRNQSLALAAAQLAAGRSGVVAPMNFEVQWKRRFDAESSKGVIQIGKSKTSFKLGKNEESGKWWVRFGKAKQEFHTGDVIKLAKTQWTVDVDADENARGKALWLTSPTTLEIQNELQRYIRAAKQQPQYLCLVGWPDALPMAIIADGQGIDADLVSDLPYAQTDDDPFLEFAHARFLATDLTTATLLACRGFARDDFPQRSWERSFATAEWETVSKDSMQAAGLKFLGHHRGDAPIKQSSPLTEAGVIVHGSHAMWTVMGKTYAWDTPTLLAPAIVETAGCSTASLDQDLERRSVAAQLLRMGAVAFVGNTRRGIAEQDLFRSEMWNALMSGSTLGEAQRKALNRTLVAVLEKGQAEGGAYFYQYYNHAVLGDPALQLHLQSTDAAAAARTEIDGKKITVFAPKTWSRTAYPPLPEWGCRFPTLYSWRGAGVGVESTWFDPEKRNQEILLYTAEAHTRRKVNSVKAVGKTDTPLGWTGSCFVDFHADGTRSLYWRVQFLDADMTTGEVRAQVEQLEFRLDK